jgi:hypothetical protein
MCSFNTIPDIAHSFLNYLIQPRTIDTTAKDGDQHHKDKEHSHLRGALSSSMAIFNVGDLFRDIRDGPKSVKFPEKLLKVLEQRLENIAMGRDSSCVSFAFLSIPPGI